MDIIDDRKVLGVLAMVHACMGLTFPTGTQYPDIILTRPCTLCMYCAPKVISKGFLNIYEARDDSFPENQRQVGREEAPYGWLQWLVVLQTMDAAVKCTSARRPWLGRCFLPNGCRHPCRALGAMITILCRCTVSVSELTLPYLVSHDI